MPEPPYSTLISGEESVLVLVAEPRSQCPVTRTGDGGLVQGEGSHKEKVTVLLFHMANKPTATVMARKLSATIHRTREVVGVVSVFLIFGLSLSFPAAGPKSNREKKQIKTSEKRLWQEAANVWCLLSPVPEHTLLESSREEGESPAGRSSGSRFCSPRGEGKQ